MESTLVVALPSIATFPFSLFQQSPSLLISLLCLLLSLGSLQSLQLRVVIVGNPQERQPIANQIHRRDGILNHRPRKRNQEPVLHHSSNVHGQSRSLSNEQEHGEVQSKSAEGVSTKDDEIQMETGVIPERRVLHDQPRDRQEHEAAGRNVVERGDRVKRDPL
ncbi:uncharacterized protein DS421_20g679800 [Arachis hypogaea]|nr:uncharacterized protein DS421_20g679800 [Arachis hypogaea]